MMKNHRIECIISGGKHNVPEAIFYGHFRYDSIVFNRSQSKRIRQHLCGKRNCCYAMESTVTFNHDDKLFYQYLLDYAVFDTRMDTDRRYTIMFAKKCDISPQPYKGAQS